MGFKKSNQSNLLRKKNSKENPNKDATIVPHKDLMIRTSYMQRFYKRY